MKISLPFDILDGCNPRRLMEWRRFNKGISSSPPLRYPIFNCTACSAVHPLGDIIAYQIEQGRGEGGAAGPVSSSLHRISKCVQGRGCQSQSACLPDHCISILANSGKKPLCKASREGRSRPLIKTGRYTCIHRI